MNDLVERYLAAVANGLPETQAKDIVAELRDLLMARIEAREMEKGQALNREDIGSILKDFGHPVVVASRYSGNEHLIGPSLYPWFWHTQRFAVGITLAVTFAIVGLRALGADEPIRAGMRGFWGAVEAGCVTFGVVTAIFIAAERMKWDMSWLMRWDPLTMPRVHVRKPKSLFESAITLFFDVLALLFWTRVIGLAFEISLRGGGEAELSFSPAWAAVYWPVLVLLAGAAIVHASDLVYPYWSRVRGMISLAGYIGGIAVVWVLLQAQPLVSVVPGAGADPAEVERATLLFNNITSVSLGVVGLVCAISAGVTVWRLIKASRMSDGVAPLMA